jgi:AcrR family transcriptional regulator
MAYDIRNIAYSIRNNPMAGSIRKRSARPPRLPPSLQAAWGVRVRAGRGRQPALSLERIVSAAMRIATANGLDAVSMARVAKEIDAATMALYRYVGAKEELLALMVDQAFEPAPAPRSAVEGWRTSLTRWARQHRDVLRRYPWVIRIPVSGPPITPNLVLWFERGLGCLAGTRLTPGEKLSALLLVNGFVRHDAVFNADIQRASKTSNGALQDAIRIYGPLLASLTTADRFPAIHEVIASGAFEHPGDPDDDFDFGLERVLDGLALLLAR